MNYDELVQAAQRSAEDAARQLGDAGVDALPSVLEGMANPWRSHGLLPVALERICASAPVDAVLGVVDVNSVEAIEAALRASAARQENDLHQGLLDRLRATDQLPTRRAKIATFFGDHGGTTVVPSLWEVFTEASSAERAGDDRPTLAVAAAVALAKTGHFEPGEYLVGLLADDYPPTSALAAEALQVAVGPGMTDALATAARDADTEVGTPAVRALFLLRNVAAVDALAEVSGSDDPEVAENAVISMNDITGLEFSGSWEPERIARKWHDHRSGFRTDLHYRLGRPLAVRDLVEFLRTDPDRHDELVEEIRFTTGVAPADRDYPPEAATEIARRFPGEGVLYRWGHRVHV